MSATRALLKIERLKEQLAGARQAAIDQIIAAVGRWLDEKGVSDVDITVPAELEERGALLAMHVERSPMYAVVNLDAPDEGAYRTYVRLQESFTKLLAKYGACWEASDGMVYVYPLNPEDW